MMNTTDSVTRGNILSRDNRTLCKANYFETCWCQLNSTEPPICPYLLRHVLSISNSSYFCVYHTIRKSIDCFNSSIIFPKNESVSTVYIYLTIVLLIIGILGNGLSIIVLLDKTLRRLSVYRNFAILCALNIFYLFAISIRHINNYHKDLRHISANLCRWHNFIIVFTGHLCSWQLVSTSIQRVHAILSLQLYRTRSWGQTLSVLFVCVALPLFIFDAQLLFNYGLFYKRHICNESLTIESKQLQRAVNFPLNNNSKLLNNTRIQYHRIFFPTQTSKPSKCEICILWNIFDTCIYALIPFLMILISSVIIIIKICERRRSTAMSGGVCHTNKRTISAQDNLSILLILINCLFLIMTGPFNIYLIIQSFHKYFSSTSFTIKVFSRLNEYLRLLQNSYHALSFIFYCLIGNKFRKVAWSICQRIYYKLIKYIYRHKASSINLHCLEQNGIITNELTVSTNIHAHNRPLLTPSPAAVARKKRTKLAITLV